MTLSNENVLSDKTGISLCKKNAIKSILLNDCLGIFNFDIIQWANLILDFVILTGIEF